MKLFLDGDALPKLLKPIIVRALDRLAIETWCVSNKRIFLGASKFIHYALVDTSPDEADNRIVELVAEQDLVITADIPLADRVIAKDAHALDHRGRLYTAENIKSCLAMRNLMQMIRENGEVTRGPAPFGAKDAQLFANQFNSFLTKQLQKL